MQGGKRALREPVVITSGTTEHQDLGKGALNFWLLCPSMEENKAQVETVRTLVTKVLMLRQLAQNLMFPERSVNKGRKEGSNEKG